MSTPPDAPSVYDHLDHRAFLAAWFAWKQQTNPRYSHRLFARRAGLSNPSWLLLVIRGKRNLTGRTIEGVLDALGLVEEDESFFRLLVELDAANNDVDRNRIWDQIRARLRFRQARVLETGAFELLSTWWVAATHELARLPAFTATPEWVSSHLVPSITVAQAQHALDLLFELGLLSREDDGSVRPTDVSLTTPHEVARLAVHNYHQGMITLAAGSIERTASEARHLGAITAAVPHSLIPTLKEEIARFQEHMLNLCDAATDPAEEVYQFNMQLFPLSQRGDP